MLSVWARQELILLINENNNQLFVQSNLLLCTVKPVYNCHPWDLKKWPFDRGI